MWQKRVEEKNVKRDKNNEIMWKRQKHSLVIYSLNEETINTRMIYNVRY
jgi:hypothetical protein